jgi:hypothetical protein
MGKKNAEFDADFESVKKILKLHKTIYRPKT